MTRVADEQHYIWELNRVRGSTEDLHLLNPCLEVAFARVDLKRAKKPSSVNGLQCGRRMGDHLPEWSSLLRAAVNAVRAVDGIADVSSISVRRVYAISDRCCLDTTLRCTGFETTVLDSSCECI